MSVHRLLLEFTLALLICLWATPAPAKEVIEAWRSPFGKAHSVSVNSSDGSCWVADYENNQVVHLAQNGAELWRGGRFCQPWSVPVDPTDGSCWVGDTYSDQVVHLAEDGAEPWRGGGFDDPRSVSVDPTDGSCWVADSGNHQVVHLTVTDWRPSVCYDALWHMWGHDRIEPEAPRPQPACLSSAKGLQSHLRRVPTRRGGSTLSERQ
jgi:hypothetical protein